MNCSKKTPLLLVLAMLLWAVPAQAEEDAAPATPETAPEICFQAAPESDSDLAYLNDGWTAPVCECTGGAACLL